MTALQPLEQFEFYPTLEATSGLSIVLFTAPGCASCRAWRALLDTYLARHPEVRVFEVDARRDEALAREYEIFHLPALFLFMEGRYHCPLQSEASLPALEAAVDAARRAPAQDAP